MGAQCVAFVIDKLQLSQPFPTLAHMLGTASPCVQRMVGELYLALRRARHLAARGRAGDLYEGAESAEHSLALGQLVLSKNEARRGWERARVCAVRGGDVYEVKLGVGQHVRRVERGEYLVPVGSGVGAMLCAAAAAGLPHVVRSLLASGVPVHYCDEHANTSLHLAAARQTVRRGEDAAWRGRAAMGVQQQGRRPFFIAQCAHAIDVRRVISRRPPTTTLGQPPQAVARAVAGIANTAAAAAASVALSERTWTRRARMA